MGNSSTTAVGKYLAVLFDEGPLGHLDDRLLLERFNSGRDTLAESAFAAMVARHGPMVRGVCRKVLGDPHSADDAAQATFLALARRADTIRRGDSLAGWLFGVAYRVSVRARIAEARRRGHERRRAAMAGRSVEDVRPETSWEDLYRELDRLPDSHRVPLVLCYLEGLSNEQAAERLRCPVRTVQRRLAQGRERLRSRLARRGLAPTTGLLGAGSGVPVPPPSAWAVSTVRIGMGCLTGRGPAIPTTVAALSRGLSRASRLATLSHAAAILTAVALGTVAVAIRMSAQADSGGPRQVARDDRPRIDVSDLADASATGYVLMNRPSILPDLSRGDHSNFQCGGRDFAEPVFCECEEVEGGDLNITLLHPAPTPGAPDPDYRPVVFDVQGRRFLARKGPAVRMSGPGGAGFSLRRFRLETGRMPADRRAFIAVERRADPLSIAPSEGETADQITRVKWDLMVARRAAARPRAEPGAGGSWAIEPRRVGRGGWAAPVAGGGVVADVVRTKAGALHVRMTFASPEVTRPDMSSEYRFVVIDTRGRRHLLHPASSHGRRSMPLSEDPAAGWLTSESNHMAAENTWRYVLPPPACDYPSAVDVASIGIERTPGDESSESEARR